MSQAHARESMIDRSGAKVLKLIGALVLMQFGLVPLTWVTINALFYGNVPDPASYQEWSMTATFEALFVHWAAAIIATTPVWWAVAALRNHLTRPRWTYEVRSSTPVPGQA